MTNRLFNKTSKILKISLKQIFYKIISILISLLIFLSFSITGFSQDVSRDNYSGKWTENATWMDNSAPAVIDIDQNCTVNGEVQHIGNLEFGDGDLIVNDTLIIFGNLILGNNADLTINPGGILIVYGDYTSGNQVMAVTGGYLVVTGNFSMLGADNQGSFAITGGAVFLLDPTPGIKVDTAYSSLNCSDPASYPDNCGYGNQENLSSSPISSIFNSGAYSIDFSGPLTFCSGASIILSVPNDGTNYQWYKNSIAIGGANLPFYTVTESGNYSLSFTIGSRVITTSAVAVTVSNIPVITGITSGSVCGPGAVNLGATASFGTINWYAAPTGGVSLGNGLSFTSPVISSTASYYVDATSNGCTTASRTAITATINSIPSAPVVGTILQPTCTSSTGSVMLSGLPAGNWILNPGGITGSTSNTTVSGLTSGTYTYTVTNIAGCSSVTSSDIVINVQPATPTVMITDPPSVCPPLTIDLTDPAVTAGSTPGLTYTYWNDPEATIMYGIPDKALEGTYYIKGTNGSGCYEIKPVTAIINTEPAVTGVTTDILCSGASTGSIDITIAGGKGPYTYNWAGPGIVQAVEDQTGLVSGSYLVAVTDANSCTSPTLQFNITEPSAMSGTIISQSNVSVFGGNDGSVTVGVSGGTSPYLYKIDAGTYQTFGSFGALSVGSHTVTIQDKNHCTIGLTVTIEQPSSTLSGSIETKTDVACFGSSTGVVTVTGSGGITPYDYKLDAGAYQSSGTFANLAAGSYVVTVRDATFTTVDLGFTISQPSDALGGSVTSQTNVLCNGSNSGNITVTGSGGVPPYKYKLGTGSYQDSGDFGNLETGAYSVTVQDANLCTKIIPVTITGPEVLSVTFTKEDVSCPDIADGRITLSISGGTEPYSVIWSDDVTSVSRERISAGTYSVIVTDFNGCTETVDVVIGNRGSENCIEIQEIITPNNDGFYDTWKIKNIELYPNAEVQVFNRWGKMVFSTKNIPANEWDATSEGTLLPTDSYHYILYLNDGSDPRSGVVSIIR
jgi:gliding motility-associated-like protein